MTSTLFQRLYLPLLLGFVARMTSSWVGLGFHARDDYFHLLAPALGWLEDPNFDWLSSDMPGAGLRSFLAPKIFYGLLMFIKKLGVENPESILSTLHLILGVYSLLTIVAVHKLAQALSAHQSTVTLATWLSALHFAMPYVGTRLLIESMAIPPLIFGLTYVARLNRSSVILGGFLISVACWFRFQLGIAAIGLALGLYLHVKNRESTPRAMQAVLCLGIGGGVGTLIQGLFDYFTMNQFLGAVVNNLQVNLNPHEELTRSGMFSYLALFIGMTIPPFTVVIAAPMWTAARRHWILTFPLLAFVLSHSLIGHKEERFMFSVLPLFLILLACIPEEMQNPDNHFRPWVRRWWPRCKKPLIVIHVVALLVTLSAQTQKNQRDAMNWLRQNPKVNHLVSLGPEIPLFLLNRDDIEIERKRKFYPIWLFWTMWEMRQIKDEPIHVISYQPDRERAGKMLAESTLALPPEIQKNLRSAPAGWDCSIVATQSGAWLDRLVYRLNPKHNTRRSPIDIWKCYWPRMG